MAETQLENVVVEAEAIQLEPMLQSNRQNPPQTSWARWRLPLALSTLFGTVLVLFTLAFLIFGLNTKTTQGKRDNEN